MKFLKKPTRIFYLQAMWCKRRCIACGYTMLELSIAISLAGVIAMTALRAIPLVYDEYRVSRFNLRLSEWVLKTEELYKVRSDYKGISLSALADLRVFDGDFVIKDAVGAVSEVRHVFNGTFDVGLPSKISITPFWAIHLSGLPADKALCASILQYAVQNGRIVAVIAEKKDQNVPALRDWLSEVTYNDGAVGVDTSPRIDGFPEGYTVVKNLNGRQKSPADLVAICSDMPVSAVTMGIAMMRKKL